jgi:phage terminase small subunit
VAEELSKIGFANMKDYMRVGPHGDPVLDFSAITRDQAAALIEVTVDDYVDGRGEDARDVRKVKFKLADKRAALMDIAKLFGWIIDKQEFREVDEFESMEERQLRQLVAERARAVAVRDDEADETGTRH